MSEKFDPEDFSYMERPTISLVDYDKSKPSIHLMFPQDLIDKDEYYPSDLLFIYAFGQWIQTELGIVCSKNIERPVNIKDLHKIITEIRNSIEIMMFDGTVMNEYKNLWAFRIDIDRDAQETVREIVRNTKCSIEACKVTDEGKIILVSNSYGRISRFMEELLPSEKTPIIENIFRDDWSPDDAFVQPKLYRVPEFDDDKAIVGLTVPLDLLRSRQEWNNEFNFINMRALLPSGKTRHRAKSNEPSFTDHCIIEMEQENNDMDLLDILKLSKHIYNMINGMFLAEERNKVKGKWGLEIEIKKDFLDLFKKILFELGIVVEKEELVTESSVYIFLSFNSYRKFKFLYETLNFYRYK